MIERFVSAVCTEHPGLEALPETRERLRELFPRGAVRRMTQLGLLLGSVLDPIEPVESDALVYASTYAENQALAEYLASFPAASPTLFQVSIHPSAVQQVLIARQRPVGELFPLAGAPHLVGHGLQAACLAPAPRAIFCGGEERGSWLREHHLASEETFAFAIALRSAPAGSIGRLRLEPSTEADPPIGLNEFAEALRCRRPIQRASSPGWRLELAWN